MAGSSPLANKYSRSRQVGFGMCAGWSRPVRTLAVPYHLDEQPPDLDMPMAADDVIVADLAAGEAWTRMAVLYDRLADAVRIGGVPAVLSGDCTTALGR
jgi:hypothetical protein